MMALVTAENHELVPYLVQRPFLARNMVLISETMPAAQAGVSVVKASAGGRSYAFPRWDPRHTRSSSWRFIS